MVAESKRERAWVLVQAEPVQGVSARIGNLDKKEDKLVVVRADIVAGSSDLPYNIVVPVDVDAEAEEGGVLARVVGEIRELAGVTGAVVLKVREHHPKPPHNAPGFVTAKEQADGKDKKVKPGRQSASPGYNGWG